MKPRPIVPAQTPPRFPVFHSPAGGSKLDHSRHWSIVTIFLEKSPKLIELLFLLLRELVVLGRPPNPPAPNFLNPLKHYRLARHFRPSIGRLGYIVEGRGANEW